MPKILLVEDDQAQCALLEALFTEEGFRVSVAHKGQQALDILDHEGEWVVLLDLVLPGMSGREVVHTLRHTPRLFDNNKVILMSASWNGGTEAQRELSEVVVSTLPKPFGLDEVLTLVRGVAE